MKKLFQAELIALMLVPSWGLAQDFEKGEKAFWASEYGAALTELLPLAEGGNTVAQFYLGVMYDSGKGVREDEGEAWNWWPQDDAKVLAANRSGSFEVALMELRTLAEKGDAHSQYLLGLMYYNGWGVPKSYTEAALWWQLSAKQGNDDAERELGSMYDYGLGVPEDNAEAVSWYRRAAEQGDEAAQSQLAEKYHIGEGVLKDYVFAYMWYNISIANGYYPADIDRDNVAERMTIQDISEAQRRARVCMASNYTDCD